jgi:hypothetical protein
MNITLRFPAEVERRLAEEAARKGLTLAEYIERLAEQSVSADRSAATPSPDAWEAAWRAWAAGHRALPSAADDDREGIYAGRGE